MSINFWLILLASSLELASSEHYHIVTSTALCRHYPIGTCFTLAQLSSHLSQHAKNITISFLPGEHILTWNMEFRDKTMVTLNSEHLSELSNSSSKIQCDLETGINVQKTKKFTLYGLVLYGCKSLFSQDYDALYIKGVTTVVIEHCQFYNNSGAIYMENGEINVSNCQFANNEGVFGAALSLSTSVVATIQTSSFLNNSAQSGGAIEVGDTVNLSLESCTFLANRAEFDGGALYITGQSLVLITYNTFVYNIARMGGAIFVGNNAQSSSIVNTTFNGNRAQEGGAIHTAVAHALLRGCFFTENNATYTGGAIFTLSSLQSVNVVYHNNSAQSGGAIYSVFVNDKFQLTFLGNTTFTQNFGEFGGAMNSFSSLVTFQENSKVIFYENEAWYGGGFYLDQSTLNFKNFETIEIAANRAYNAGGGIYATNSVIEIDSLMHSGCTEAYLAYNMAANGSGLYLTSSTLRLTNSNVTIKGNSAQQFGGGIYLQLGSKLTIYAQNLSDPILTTYIHIIRLVNNSAHSGGGLYISDSRNPLLCDAIRSYSDAYLSTKQCFFQSIKRETSILSSATTIVFANNSAVETGSDIYGGLLDRCTISPFAEIVQKHSEYIHYNGISYLQAVAGFDWGMKKETIKDICHKHLVYDIVTNVSQFHYHISSDPVRVCFCHEDVIGCNYTYPTVFKKKGEMFTLSVVAVDQVGRPVNATLISSLPQTDNGRLKEGQQYRSLGDCCTELKYNVYSGETSAMLELYADGPCGNLGISKQYVHINFLPCTCPIGLEDYLSPIDCVCDCDKTLNAIVSISNCSPVNGTIQINDNLWVEFTNDTNTTYVACYCPFNYCIPKPVNISLATQREADEQCAFNRTGRLCGQCAQGLSLVFASSRCRQCSNYYLFLLLPFALAGIALVVFILLLNITVATGTIHGLIFYANILAANQSIFIPFETPNFLTVFISWLNLDLGIETCFFNGMNSYGKFLLQLVFPVYIIFLIGTIIVLCNCSSRIARLFGKRDPEATLYTLVYLSYSKLVRIIITALHFAYIDYPTSPKLFWLYDANIPYFTASHIPRFLVAFIIIILGVFYTILLLCGQAFNCCSNTRLMKWSTHKNYIHFMKAHHAPLSDRHRYWVGLLLLARLVHYLISAFSNDFTVILSVATITLLLLLNKLANKSTFSNWIVDWLETLFIANLTLLAISTFYVRELSSGSQQTLAILSMSVSFIAFLGIVFYHILYTCGTKPDELTNKLLKFRKNQLYQPVAIIEECSEDNENENNHNSDQSTNSVNGHSPAYHALPADQLREPALDDLIPVQPEDYSINVAPALKCRGPTFSEVKV